MKKTYSVIILAAGQGTRMASPLPKVVHPVAGLPMIYRVVKATQKAGASDVRVVVGHGETLVRQVVEPLGAACHRQKEQKGTADAVRSAQIESLEGLVVIMNGDHPLITSEMISSLVAEYHNGEADLAVVTCELKDPKNYGRVVRHHGALHSIVEAKDASAETLKIREVNTGMYLVDAKILQTYLGQIKPLNAQKEFYLTDLVSLCREAKKKVVAIKAPKEVSAGVNSQKELAYATRMIFKRKIVSLMEQGVVVIDPTTTYIEDEVQIGPASVIYPQVFIKGRTKIGAFCVIEPHSFIMNSQMADGVQIRAGSYVQESTIDERSVVGPYAHLRPETKIGKECKIGNFVELKKVQFSDRAKASHLTYLGDAEIGEDTNIGCGTITCNYAVDHKKYKTKIGKNVFVGSDSQFIAPVTVGDNAIVASGSTITKNVPAGSLAVARGRQRNVENYKPKTSETPEDSASKG